MFDFLDIYPWLLPFIIFFGRICDVTLGTLRIIFVSKGEKYKAPLIGFFEVFIWICIISQVLLRANDLVAYLSYAAGYACGNYIGILIEQRIAFGIVICRGYTNKDGSDLTRLLNKHNFGSTLIHAQGAYTKVDVVETVIKRKSLPEVEKLFLQHDPDIFYLIEDIRSKRKGVFSKTPSVFQLIRAGK